MFGFFKKIFWDKPVCTDCQSLETETSADESVSQVTETTESVVEVNNTVDATPEVIEQPSLKIPTTSEETVEKVEENIAA